MWDNYDETTTREETAATKTLRELSTCYFHDNVYEAAPYNDRRRQTTDDDRRTN